MKLIVRVKVNEQVVEVNVDEDYVAASEDSVKSYVAYELYDIFGKTIVDFTVLNIDDIIADLAVLDEPFDGYQTSQLSIQ